jgi:hypothetical protein
MTSQLVRSAANGCDCATRPRIVDVAKHLFSGRIVDERPTLAFS